ncbi:endonuclease/exonuclease/phosphatase family protein [Allomuricauda sp. NBRC 101325]|uniref:endonuclease/exonuclease/phosphatase family protein n=1 Tax=Allomuricauda sp. NBRC 101325 TaxID=1113758 RepID=UPI0024A54659|nr:endonuclease/exonuclease/phosphatase family protein [Muricauda sp. NBRC 101325]GLU44234.1 endonuclease [Muricauda sp. NBRC 101325]
MIAILIGYMSFGHFYGLNTSKDDSIGDKNLKIMSYNVWGFNRNGWIKEEGVGDSIITFIKNQSPDILVIQEHSRIRYQQLRQYPYRSETPISAARATQAIFSKYPIIGQGSLDLPETMNNIIYADIVFGSDTLRIYNLHLQSFKIIPSSDNFSDSEKSEKLLRRLVGTFSKQTDQAKIFKEHIDKSPYPNIICGDFNNTQFSSVYKMVKGNMEDTFLQKGSGFGRTYDLLKFPIRIDYILADPEFEILSHQNFDVKLSDHYPIMATLKLPSHQ